MASVAVAMLRAFLDVEPFTKSTFDGMAHVKSCDGSSEDSDKNDRKLHVLVRIRFKRMQCKCVVNAFQECIRKMFFCIEEILA